MKPYTWLDFLRLIRRKRTPRITSAQLVDHVYKEAGLPHPVKEQPGDYSE